MPKSVIDVWRVFSERVFRFPDRHGAAACWALAFALFLAALAARLALSGHASGLPFLTFFPTIILTTLICGWRQALAGLALACASAYVLLPPPSWYGGNGPMHATISLALFVFISLLQIGIVAALAEAVRVNYRLAAHEKTLFLELQHRVANTLQFIATMLTVARQDIVTLQQADAVLEQATARIVAVGHLHRRMYDAAHDGRGFVPLLHDILAELFQDLPVTVRIEAGQVRLALSQMTPVVLLVTEAATNSAKHVFRQGQGSKFEVILAPVGARMLRLFIRDDGPGMANTDTPSLSLGLRIMRGLASQLGGKLRFENQGGAVVALEFPKD